MVWFFRRQREQVQMDTFFDNETSEFVLRLHHPDGSQDVERFASLAQFREGIESTEQRLLADRWMQDGEPIFIPDGFPKRRLN